MTASSNPWRKPSASGANGDAASIDAPTQAARGIDSVIVNGVPVWREGRSTGARLGRMLRAGAAAERATTD